MGEDFSAKDFRTWAGTVAAARALTMPECADISTRNVNTCIKAVAGLLGNTAAVAKSAYIHPAVLDAYTAGKLDLPNTDGRPFELAVLRFLERVGRQRGARPR
jgi:DNA topoisomerase-1